MNTQERTFRQILYGGLGMLLVVMVGASVSHGALIWGFEQRPWDHGRNHIIRDGKFVTGLIPTIEYGAAGGYDYWWIDDAEGNSRGYSAAAAASERLVQHVFIENASDSTAHYKVNNYIENRFNYRIDTAEAHKVVGSKVKDAYSFVLDGEMSIVKGVEKSLKGTLAVFNVEIAAQGLSWPNQEAKRMFKGSVKLIGRRNGTIKLRVTGDLKKSMISEIVKTDDSYTIYFDEVTIPYTIVSRVGEDFEILTNYQSQVFTEQAGAFAEVKWWPDSAGSEIDPGGGDPGNPIPEPTAAILLGLGLVPLLRRRRIA